VTVPWLQPTPAGVELRVLVQPRASRSELAGIQGDELKLRLAAPPVDGAANAACCAFFAKLCRLPKSAVTLTAGTASRHKRLLLKEADPVELLGLLNPPAEG
jgi:hypothetical protein